MLVLSHQSLNNLLEKPNSILSSAVRTKILKCTIRPLDDHLILVLAFIAQKLSPHILSLQQYVTVQVYQHGASLALDHLLYLCLLLIHLLIFLLLLIFKLYSFLVEIVWPEALTHRTVHLLVSLLVAFGA